MSSNRVIFSFSYQSLTSRREDIQTCQNAGKIVLLSLGGAVGEYGFSGASQAQTFARTLWNLFGEGTSDTRPFGSSVVDGFDLDIENNRPEFYSDFITALRALFAKGSKKYYIASAPQYAPSFPFLFPTPSPSLFFPGFITVLRAPYVQFGVDANVDVHSPTHL